MIPDSLDETESDDFWVEGRWVVSRLDSTPSGI